MFGQTVTLYHHVEGSDGTERWERMVLSGVHFSATSGERVSGKGARADAGGILLIPFAGHAKTYVPPGAYGGSGWTIGEGDRVLEGAFDDEITRSPSELRRLGTVSTVTSIRRLPFGGLAHWKIWCDGSQY